ncbi:hypothetical protein [Dyadobacter chenhuakuii]|uniref:Uncharacterized protein n=1 Tax=Dyadobacter chenhuakuii TaxID=2909339 RepID=A0A9X1QC63_9BACT|nr:hypothetical protein [Dyadobacter chenhuakuii]MCF2498344.1 hypothetical protein [Dyadobacter chenhuakuii]
MKKELNPVLQRLSDWADTKGGFAEIGRRVQKHPSMFYNLIRRDALPSLATLSEIATAFPELDMNYIIRGSESVDVIELNELKNQLKIKDATITKLVMPGKAKGANLCPDRDHDFRIEGAKQMMHNARSAGKKKFSKPMSVRVPGVKVPSLIDLFEK